MTQPSSQGPCTCPEMGWRNDCPRHEHMQDTERGGVGHVMWKDHLAERYVRDLCERLFRLYSNYYARTAVTPVIHFDVLLHPRAVRRLQQDREISCNGTVHFDFEARRWFFMDFRVLESHDVDEYDVRLVIKSDHPWLADLRI